MGGTIPIVDMSNSRSHIPDGFRDTGSAVVLIMRLNGGGRQIMIDV